jgi:CRISPR-associated endonuclease/helicase Cas3
MTPDFDRAREWALRALSLSRKGPVRKLREMGIPEGWKQSPLLRNCFPLELDSRGCWMLDQTVRLDEDLGLIYEETKENE